MSFSMSKKNNVEKIKSYLKAVIRHLHIINSEQLLIKMF